MYQNFGKAILHGNCCKELPSEPGGGDSLLEVGGGGDQAKQQPGLTQLAKK